MCSHTFLTQLDSIAANCDYADYVAKHVTYPPRGPLPLPGDSSEFDPACDIWDIAINAATLLNPYFDVYKILVTVSTSTPLISTVV